MNICSSDDVCEHIKGLNLRYIGKQFISISDILYRTAENTEKKISRTEMFILPLDRIHHRIAVILLEIVFGDNLLDKIKYLVIIKFGTDQPWKHIRLMKPIDSSVINPMLPRAVSNKPINPFLTMYIV